MLGFVEHFDLRMVRPQVALAARIRAPGLLLGKAVTRVTRGAASFAAIGIDAAYTVLGQVAGSSLPSLSTFTLEPWH